MSTVINVNINDIKDNKMFTDFELLQEAINLVKETNKNLDGTWTALFSAYEPNTIDVYVSSTFRQKC